MVKRLLLFSLLTCLLVAAGVAILFATIDLKQYQHVLSDVVYEKTGRQLIIDGGVNLALFPPLSLTCEDVYFTSGKGYSSPYLLKTKRLHIGVKLLSLFKGKIAVDTVVIDKPEIFLEKNELGANWQVSISGAPADKSTGSVPAEQSMQHRLDVMRADIMKALHVVGALTVQGGTVHYKTPSSSMVVEQVDLSLLGNKPSKGQKSQSEQDVTLSISGRFNGYDFSLSSASLGRLLSGKKGEIEWSAKGHAIESAGVGAVRLSLPEQVTLELKVPSLIHPLFELKEAKANIRMDVQALPSMAVRGEVNVDSAHIFRADQKKASSAKLSASVPAEPTSKSWQSYPIPWEVLQSVGKGVTADLTVDVSTLYDDKKPMMEGLHAVLHRDDKKINVHYRAQKLYGGEVDLAVTLLPAPSEKKMMARLDVKGLDTKQFLSELSTLTKGGIAIDGKASLQANLAAQGETLGHMLASLEGQGSASMGKGGVGLKKLPKKLSDKVPSLLLSKILKKDAHGYHVFAIDSLSAPFTIHWGTLTTQGAQLASPHVDVESVGSVNLVNQQVALKLVPVTKGSMKEMFSWRKGSLMVNVTGPMTQPNIDVDLTSFLPKSAEDVEKISRRVKDLPKKVEQFKEGVKALEKGDPKAIINLLNQF